MIGKNISPAKLIAIGFLLVILIGAFILMLPISRNPGIEVSFVDALFTSTSAVCVTGLIAIDTAKHFNGFGRTIVAMLIQIGGLGVTSIGISAILLMGKRLGLKHRTLVREAWNVNSLKGVVRLVRSVLLLTLLFEGIGAFLSYLVFRQDFTPGKALEISLFHSVAAFNNSGFDILGGLQNLIPYQNDILLNLTSSALIIFGGLGFLVILDIVKSRSWKKLHLHSKVVIVMTGLLLIVGTLLLKATENISWLGAFFQSTSARTAGFSTYPIGSFTNAGLFTLSILMFIGASPGSTGGGIKTTTMFVVFQSVRSIARNRHCQSFQRKIPSEVITKAFLVTILSIGVVVVGTFAMCILEPKFQFIQNMFEVISAFGTVGLSTGITPKLGIPGKLLIVMIMYIGRLGPLSIACLWGKKDKPGIHFSEEMIPIG